MYAILETGGKQYRVQEQSVLEVEALPAAPGEQVALERVLMVADDFGVQVGTPVVGEAKVICRVVAQGRARRITVFKYKAKENYRRLRGHRQRRTRLLVERIEVGGSQTES
jgi:large subunit ribosomal protein L21